MPMSTQLRRIRTSLSYLNWPSYNLIRIMGEFLLLLLSLLICRGSFVPPWNLSTKCAALHMEPEEEAPFGYSLFCQMFFWVLLLGDIMKTRQHKHPFGDYDYAAVAWTVLTNWIIVGRPRNVLKSATQQDHQMVQRTSLLFCFSYSIA